MKNTNSELYKELWSISNVLRGKMDPDEFKNYILSFIFFKYLSEKLETCISIEHEMNLEEINQLSKDEYRILEAEVVMAIGYFFEPKYTFSNLIKEIKLGKKDKIVEFLSKAFSEIVDSTIGKESNDDFKGLFSDVNLYNPKLGSDDSEIQSTLGLILEKINDIPWSTMEDNNDILGDAYEFLISMFASSAGKKGGEFYTPPEVSQILAEIVASQASKIRTIYDPTCGSGSLLIKAFKNIESLAKEKKYTKMEIASLKIKGQELNHTTYNLARMNMFLHGINHSNFHLQQGDTIRNDKFSNEDKFNAIVANPPFGTKWNPNEKDYLAEDERFSKYGELAPASRAEYTFVQHMLEHLHQDGIMATVLPHGILFRGNQEGVIRRHIIDEQNALDAVIGLPSNLFFGTGIPAIIAVYKKCRKTDEPILFVDAKAGFAKDKNKNTLREKDVRDIINVYVNKLEIDKHNKEYDLISRMVEIKEIANDENSYNLNISRYIDDSEEIIYRDLINIQFDIDKLVEDENKLEKEIKESIKKMNL